MQFDYRYERLVRTIANLDWVALSRDELLAVQWAYYYFSVQFRESLEIACRLHPADRHLAQLKQEECGTANLSPYSGVAAPGEQMNHDEFMRRSLMLAGTDPARQAQLERLGERYLAATRALPEMNRALAIASYEDGGLEAVFRAILTAPDWDHPALLAFRHFLQEHIRFDSDETAGHGALSRHLAPDDRVEPLWSAFLDLFTDAAPALERPLAVADAA